MKKRTRAGQKRLNNLLLILLLSAVLLIMSTYAWFTANRTVNIDSISLHVTTSSGLQISADGKEWKTVLDYDDIKNATAVYTDAIDQLPENLAPTSSIANASAVDSDGHLAMYFGDIDTDLDSSSSTYGQYLLTTSLQTDTQTFVGGTSGTNKNDEDEDYSAGYYFAFDIFLKDTVAADALYMSGSVTDANSSGKGLENAVRIALIKGSSTSDADTPATVQALTTVGSTEVSLWEPNADSHTTESIQNGYDLGWTSLDLASSGADAITYDGVKGVVKNIELSQALAANYSDGFETVTPTWTTTKSETADLKMKSGLDAGATIYRVYMWIEGQDIDCQNYASGSDLEYNLSFSLDSYTGTAKDPQ